MTTPAGEEVRRWYPTATTLPNGDVLVLSGSYIDLSRPQGRQVVVVDLVQVWSNGVWTTIRKADGAPLNFIGLPLYPRMHVVSDGRVFMSGTNDRTLLLTTSEPGRWDEVGLRAAGNRDYCPAVRYGDDQIMYIGGGNNIGDHRPTAQVEVIDLGAVAPQWRTTGPMTVPRRQHNAVVLPDGTVLVTGGTRGGGGFNNGFNDLDPGQPVHTAELWDPATEQWTELSAESVDRCYHATAVLLPDATVLSAGGGEYRPDNVNPNLPEDSHRNAQIFIPPYLFKGGRPEIAAAPDSLDYGETFELSTADADDIARVSLIRLPSVTHSIDQNQLITFLEFQPGTGRLTIDAPASQNGCPPGHYMLFLLNRAGVPSIAKIVRVRTASTRSLGLEAPVPTDAAALPIRDREYLQVYAREAAVRAAARGTAVVVGITGTCPYGLGACWGGAYEALSRLDGVDLVSPVPDVDDSTAEVFLDHDGIPGLDTWHEQFSRIANGTYELRGVEVTLLGRVELREEQLHLVAGAGRASVRLVPLRAADKIQWDHTTRSRKPLGDGEQQAFERLLIAARDTAHDHEMTVTGPLRQTGAAHELSVRLFSP
jgi:galactose oxidase